jgi:glutathione reductase (NADPH)
VTTHSDDDDRNQAGGEEDHAVHGAGRIAAVDRLELDKADVRASRRGVEVNEFLRSTSNPAVYAAGDAAASPGWPLTPVASLEGEVVAANLLEGNHQTPNYTGVSSAVFTIPELARVGLLEGEARAGPRRRGPVHRHERLVFDRAGRREACGGQGAGRAV